MKRFFPIPNELLATRLIDPYAKLVYAVISSFTLNGKNKCFNGSNGYISIVTGLHLDTVKAKIKMLREKKWILSNGLQNERRRLWAVPLDEIDEIQKEYIQIKEQLLELSAPEEGFNPLEELVAERQRQKTLVNAGTIQQVEGDSPSTNVGTTQQEEGDSPSTNVGTNHNYISNKTRNETRNYTSDDSSKSSSLISSDVNQFKNIQVKTTDETSEDLQLLLNMLERCRSNELGFDEAISKFREQTQRRVVWYGQLEQNGPTDFYIDVKHPATQLRFQKQDFIVVNSNDFKEIMSHYE